MRAVGFCGRCRGMVVGWNMKYLVHLWSCDPGRYSVRSLAYAAVTLLLITGFPTVTHQASGAGEPRPSAVESLSDSEPSAELPDTAVAAIEDVIGRHARVSAENKLRIARAVVESSRKYDVDPFLVASILLVESSANPFAISNRDAVGIMQIHVPTWGAVAVAERLSLFRIEDNIDLGTRILKDYTRRHGVWQGVLRYLGASDTSEEGETYVRRVQTIYSDRLAD